MKCDRFVKHGVYSFSIITLGFYGIDHFFERTYGFSRFVVSHLLLPFIMVSSLLFLYTLYCLRNSFKEKVLALILVIVVPYASFYGLLFFKPKEDLQRYHKIYMDMYYKEVFKETKTRDHFKTIDEAFRDYAKRKRENEDAFENKWNKVKYEGDLSIITKKSLMYRLLVIMLLGIVSVAALYASTIYTLTSVIGVSLMYVGTIVLGLIYYSGQLHVVFSYMYPEISLVLLELIMLLISLVIVVYSAYRDVKSA